MSQDAGHPGTAPRIEIAPTDALVDAPVTMRLDGLPAGQHVTVRAQMAHYLGYPGASRATVHADAQGRVDVSTQRPADGTYELLDPMGLCWSMAPPAGAAVRGISPASVAPLQVQCTAEVNGAVVASAQVERRLMAPQVSRTDVRDEGLVATLFRPPDSGRCPTVIVVGGSGGGLWEAPAALWASHGVVTLALAYCGIAPLPPGLEEIPLEYFSTAMHWLQRQAGVQPQALAVLGASRGGELALLFGATFSEIRAVVAYVPSGVLWMGLPVGGTAPRAPTRMDLAWSATAFYAGWHRRQRHRVDPPAGGPGTRVCRRPPKSPPRRGGHHSCGKDPGADLADLRAGGSDVLATLSGGRRTESAATPLRLSRRTCELSPGGPSPDVTAPANDAAFQTASDPAHRCRLWGDTCW
jgi:dienelactone hydrolase